MAPLDAPLEVLIRSVREQGFEGLVAKRRDSRYESGERSGAWLKMRVNQGQEFVIGGYTVAAGASWHLIEAAEWTVVSSRQRYRSAWR